MINKVLNYPKKQRMTKYHHDTGLILHHCEIKIYKDTKKVEYRYRQHKVIISNDKFYCVENEYGGLELIEKLKKSDYQSYRTINRVKAYEQKWNSRYSSDYLTAYSISTFSEKVTKNRVKKALYNFIRKEAYFYSGLEFEIEAQLKLIQNGKQ